MKNFTSKSQSFSYDNLAMDTLVRVVINSLPSPSSKRNYSMSIRDFLEYLEEHEGSNLDKLFLQTYIAYMQDNGVGEGSINLRLAAIRKLSREAEDLNVWPESVAAAFASVKNIPQRGNRTGNWLSLEQAQMLINSPDISKLVGLRDRALLSVLLGCGLRRHEVAKLKLSHLQLREGRWIISDLVGKRNKTRTIVVPGWAKQAINAYLEKIDIDSGFLFKALTKAGTILRERISVENVRYIVGKYAKKCGLSISTHDLRRTYAKLAWKNGAKIDQIQLNLGHESLSTTQIYLGTELDLKKGPGDYLSISIF